MLSFFERVRQWREMFTGFSSWSLLRGTRRATQTFLWLALASAPLVMWTSWTDAHELPKQLVFILLVSLALIMRGAEAVQEREWRMPVHWLFGVLSVFAVGYTVMACWSTDTMRSFFGGSGLTSWSVLTVLFGTMFAALIAESVRSVRDVYRFGFAFFVGGFLAALDGILHVYGVGLLSLLHVHPAATLTGSVYNLGLFLVIPLVMAMTRSFYVTSQTSRWEQGCLWIGTLVSLYFIRLVDDGFAWFIIFFTTFVVVGVEVVRRRRLPVAQFIMPGLFLFFSVLFLLFASRHPLPAEISPNVSLAWQVARGALTAHPLVGTGAETWADSYFLYRPMHINATPFWQTPFDRASSTWLTLMPTLGLVGIVFLIGFLGVLSWVGYRRLFKEVDEETWEAQFMIMMAWSALLLVDTFYHATMVHQISLFALIGLLVGMVPQRMIHIRLADGSWKAIGGIAVTAFCFCIGIVGTGFVIRDARAESYFRLSVRSESGLSLDDRIHTLERLVVSHPKEGAYQQALSQAYALRVENALKTKPDTEGMKGITADAARAIELGRLSVARAPTRIEYVVNLAILYERIMGFVPGADDQALSMLERAQILDPMNPVYPNEVGRLLVLRADAYKKMFESKDKAKVEDAKNSVALNLDQAKRALLRAIELKSDYLPAHYHLAVVAERQNKIDEAVQELEGVLRVRRQDSGIAFELALLYYKQGSLKNAIQLLEQVTKAAPDLANAQWYLASLYQEQGREDDAIAALQTLLTLTQGNEAVKQRLDILKQQKAERQMPKVVPLPEPLKEDMEKKK